MPVLKPAPQNAPVNYPEQDYIIVKYLDVIRYISLLQRRSLFFCRLDKLEDQFEGTTAKMNRQVRYMNYHFQSTKGYIAPMTHEEILKKVEEQYEHDNNIKGLTCVNCWNKFTNESAALWKIYSNFKNGIMLKSSISQLVNSLESSEEEIQLTEMVYFDYNKFYMPDGNSNYPLIHKHEAYNYEQEVRLIYTRIPETGWVYDWSKEEVIEGIYIKADIDKLISEIVISPDSPNWFIKLIEDISVKYSLQKPITKSILSVENK